MTEGLKTVSKQSGQFFLTAAVKAQLLRPGSVITCTPALAFLGGVAGTAFA